MPEAHRVYLSAIENRGQSFEGKPRVTLSTIHGAKGGEAQNVILYTDLSYASTREAFASQEGSDDLHRTFYVGITRTKDRLFLVLPRSEKESFRLDTDYRYG
jgi:superfamily I DNA/RNA helicase